MYKCANSEQILERQIFRLRFWVWSFCSAVRRFDPGMVGLEALRIPVCYTAPPPFREKCVQYFLALNVELLPLEVLFPTVIACHDFLSIGIFANDLSS